jgi:hypothetical protein
LLRNIDKEDAGAVATTLYRCGFTREDQLLEQLATALAAPVAPRPPRTLVSSGVAAALLICGHKDSCTG